MKARLIREGSITKLYITAQSALEKAALGSFQDMNEDTVDDNVILMNVEILQDEE